MARTIAHRAAYRPRRRIAAAAAPAPFVLPLWPIAIAFVATLALVAPVRETFVALLLRPVAWGLVATGPTPRPWVDAVAVSGGGDAAGTREAPAAQMIKSGRARVAVALGGPLPPGDPDRTYAGAVARRLRAQGVPEASIVRTDEGRTTVHELLALRTLAEERGWRSIAIATTDWHSRRVAAAAERVFAGSSVRWGILIAPTSDVELDAWWQSAPDRGQILDEWLKLMAMRVGLA